MKKSKQIMQGSISGSHLFPPIPLEVDGEVRFHDGSVEGEFNAGHSFQRGLSGRKPIATGFENSEGLRDMRLRSDEFRDADEQPVSDMEVPNRYPHRY